MPKNETVLYILVASPSDVQPERDAVGSVVSEWNQTWSRELEIRLEPIGWESHSHPNFDTDPQAVINKQLGDDYDIFIGVLWTRFGTRTPRAKSGTAEEFERALARHKKAPETISVKVYFKDEAIPPSEIDGSQLMKVQAFQKQISGLGGLYHKFTSTDEFEKVLRMHLSYEVQAWKKRIGAGGKPETANEASGREPKRKQAEKEEEEDEEEGFLDLVEKGTLGFKSVTEISARMTGATETLNECMVEMNEELKNLTTVQQEKRLKQSKGIIKKGAGGMNSFSDRIQEEIPKFKEAYSVAMDSYGKAAALLRDFQDQDSAQVEAAIQSVGKMKTSLEGASESMAGVRESVRRHPRITTIYNKAKRRTIETLASLIREMRIGINLTTEVETTMRNVLKEFREDEKTAPL